ncbi:MAG: OFA family MFS transporter [Coriobacteriia bacterium]|nr:OFA family MFS transporter [Coriobacteriia bacterium]
MKPNTRGWIVTFAGLTINLALGVLYTWSIVAKALTKSAAAGGLYGWTAQQANWPYAFAVGTFALTMVFAGRLQDRIGPRIVATAGGVMVGLGMLVASFSPAHLAAGEFPRMMVLGFGILTGMGIGLAYASATPAAVKWFPARRKGLIAGIVVGGFGLASIYTAPLTTYLITTYSVNQTFLYLGIAYFAVIVLVAQLLNNPPTGYVPPGSYVATAGSSKPVVQREYTWREMVRTPSFYGLWFMYAFAAFAGLMIVGILAKVATLELGAQTANTMSYVLVATLALGNGIGRPVAGVLSDRIGRRQTMLIVFVFQAIMMLLLGFATTAPLLMGAAFFIGFNYGSNLTLFPTTTYDFFGTKNGGVNYGLIFTAWGVGGVFGSQLAAFIFDHSKTLVHPAGSYAVAYYIAAGLLVLASALSFVVKAPVEVESSSELIPDEA